MSWPGLPAAAGPGELVPMIGHPVAQTKLPDSFNAHAEHEGLPHRMTRVDVAPAELESFVTAIRTRRDVAGFLSTIPHKAALAGLVDDCTDRVQVTGVCNTVVRADAGRLFGDMLDGLAMCTALESVGVTLPDAHVTIAGAGAAGRAIALELARCGARRVELRDVDRDVALDAARAVAGTGPAAEIVVVGRDEGRGTILVNASPTGMYDDTTPFDDAELDRATVIADAVTSRVTPLLRQAADRRVVTVDGAQMAAAQLEPLLRLLAIGPDPFPEER